METRDLNLAAALVATGHQLTRVTPQGGHVVFEFPDSAGVHETVDAYYGRRLTVSAIDYGEATRSLKAAAMAARQQPAGVT